MAQLSNRYATALFRLATEQGQLNEFLQQAEVLQNALKEPKFQQIVTHPRITTAEKQKLFNEAFSSSLHKDMMGFLCLAVAKNREAFILPALTAFIDMANNMLRRATASVVSAVPLRGEQIEAIQIRLSKKLNKQVTVDAKVDPSVLGGLFIQVDGYFMDCTVKSQLRELKKSFDDVV